MAAGFDRSLGATAIRVSALPPKVGGKIERRGGGEGDRARDRLRPGWVAGPRPPSPI